MEKRKPHHNLADFQEVVETIAMTRTCQKDAQALGMNRAEMMDVLKNIKGSQFYKSMTSYTDHRQWHDVYHVPWASHMLYIKFTDDRITVFRLLSFKEK